MVRLVEQVRKARARAAGQGIEALAAHGTDGSTKVVDLAPPSEIARRLRYLEAHEPAQARVLFERVLNGNELQSVNYLERGARASRAVCRLSLRNPDGRLAGYGTGFLVAPGLLLTNNHVFPDARSAELSFAEFDYALDEQGLPRAVSVVALEPRRFFATSQALDFSLVATRPASRDGRPLDEFGWLPLIAQTGKVLEGEWLTIVQHPDGDPKMVCVRENRLLKRDDDVLWYSTDTMGGSSGSPVFNNDWQVVALHHSGVPETDANGNWLTWAGDPFVDGKHGEADIKWIANEGIRISRIVQTLREQHGANPELSQFLAQATPLDPAPVVVSRLPPANGEPAMSDDQTRRVTVTLEIDGRGEARVIGQSRLRESVAAMTVERDDRAKPEKEKRDVREFIDWDPDYGKANRPGYDPDFLKSANFEVPLPILGDGNLLQAAPLLSVVKDTPDLKAPRNQDECLLNYKGYSIVMNRNRRMAIYSAANVNNANRILGLYSRTSRWEMERRIADRHQLPGSYYERNDFDRGHLTRNEDMEYGSVAEAPADEIILRTLDTFHYTNAAPQHSVFNRQVDWKSKNSRDRQRDGRPLWQGLEQFVYERSIRDGRYRAMVITGPIFDEGDPELGSFKGVQYPLEFWKVLIAEAKDPAKLTATAFLMDQSDIIDVEGLERFDLDAGDPLRLYQVRISEIERRTGLQFTVQPKADGAEPQTLSEFDVLAGRAPRRPARGSGPGALETVGASGRLLPTDYLPIADEFDIVLPD